MTIKTLAISGISVLGIGGGVTGTYYLSEMNKPKEKKDEEIDALLKKWIGDDEIIEKQNIKDLIKETRKRGFIKTMKKGEDLIIEALNENNESQQKIKEFCTENKDKEILKNIESFEILKKICTK